MNKKKKITILVCTLFMVFSLGACGKTKEDATVVTQQESSLQIESMDEETTSEESTTFNNDEEDDIELKATIEIDFTLITQKISKRMLPMWHQIHLLFRRN